MADNQVKLKTDVGDQVIARINSLCEGGFVVPKGYNFNNAIKTSVLKLRELRDKNGKPALDVCSPSSIQAALFKMVTRGLNASLNQCYFIVRGDQLCCDDSYFGKILMVKRIHPDYEPVPVVIREGDVFEFGVNKDTGKRFVIKHEQKLENLDKSFVGAYMYLPSGELYLMTKKQILAAWSKSSNKSLSVHKEFEEKMVLKTVINSGLNKIISGTPEYNISDGGNDTEDEAKQDKAIDHADYTEYEDVQEDGQPTVDKETGEIKHDKPQEQQAKPQEQDKEDLNF